MNQLKAMLVGSPKEHVIAIDKLEVDAAGHLQARIARHAQPLIGLAHVDPLVGQRSKCRQRTMRRPVIDKDDLPLAGRQRQTANAFDALAQQIRRQIVAGDDKTDQRPIGLFRL